MPARLAVVTFGGGVAERWTGLIDLELVDGAFLAFLGLVGALAEAASDDRPHPLLEGLGDVLGGLAPYLAGQEQGVAVLPLPRSVVPVPGR